MKKLIIILIMILSISSYIIADEIKLDGDIGVTTNYVLFGKSLSDDKQSLQSHTKLSYKGFYTSFYVNSIKVNSEDELQTWTKVGYNYDIDDKSYIKTNYVLDHALKNKYETAHYIEIMAGSSHLNFVSFDFYNLNSIDNNDWVVISGKVSGDIDDKQSLSLTAGQVKDSRNYYELFYDYDTNSFVTLYTKIVYTDYFRNEKDNFFLSGVKLNF